MTCQTDMTETTGGRHREDQIAAPDGVVAGHSSDFVNFSNRCYCDLHCGPKYVTLYLQNNSITNWPIFTIFGFHTPEEICNHTIAVFPTSPKTVATLPRNIRKRLFYHILS